MRVSELQEMLNEIDDDMQVWIGSYDDVIADHMLVDVKLYTEKNRARLMI